VALSSVLTIGGVGHNAASRIANRLRLDLFRRDIKGGYDELAFTLKGSAPDLAYPLGTAVSLALDFGLGGGSSTYFQGEITDVSWGVLGNQWAQAYTCQGLKYQSDRVPVTGPDLTGSYTLNRTPDDAYYVSADAGLNLGAMFKRLLEIQDTCDALDAIGIQYASTSPPTLHATTLADLALLTIVPPQPITFAGESIFSQFDQHTARWMPKFVVEVTPTGIVRWKDTTDAAVFVPRTITLPGPGGAGDPGAMWPRVRASTARCATRLKLRGGPQVGVALLSEADGTLAPAWSSPDQSAWRLYDYTQPKDSKDSGTISSLTANTATVSSSDNTLTWASNSWPAKLGVVYLTNSVATGLALTEHRQLTANTALTAGGTSILTWDASQPLDSTGYNTYRIVANAGGKADVGRLFNVREPSTGNIGLATYIGAHLVVRSPIPLPWANNSRSVEIYYATAIVRGGSVPVETPLGVEALPGTGQFRLVEPDVLPNGDPSYLSSTGWPPDVAHGLPIDVQVLALYARGLQESVVPADVMGAPQYEGTAYTAMGLEVTKTIDVPAYVNQWDTVAMTALAQQHLDSLKDVVYELTAEMWAEPTFDIFTFNYALNYAIAGTTSPWSAINAPVRAVSLRWPQGEGAKHVITWEASTQRRPFAGDDLYLHPSFTGNGILSNLSSGMDLSGLAGLTQDRLMTGETALDHGSQALDQAMAFGNSAGKMSQDFDPTGGFAIPGGWDKQGKSREERSGAKYVDRLEREADRNEAKYDRQKQEEARHDARRDKAGEFTNAMGEAGGGSISGENSGEMAARLASQRPDDLAPPPATPTPSRQMTRDEAMRQDAGRRAAARDKESDPARRAEADAAQIERREKEMASYPAGYKPPHMDPDELESNRNRRPGTDTGPHTRDEAMLQDKWRREQTRLAEERKRNEGDSAEAGGGE
jgi:hypothetical protein